MPEIKPGQVIRTEFYEIYIMRLSYTGAAAWYYFISAGQRTEYAIAVTLLQEFIAQGKYTILRQPSLIAFPIWSPVFFYYDESKGETFRAPGNVYFYISTDGENWWGHSRDYHDDNPFLVASGADYLGELYARQPVYHT